MQDANKVMTIGSSLFLVYKSLIPNVDKPWESAIDNQLKMNSDIQTDLQTDLQILILYYQVRFPFPTGLIVIHTHLSAKNDALTHFGL